MGKYFYVLAGLLLTVSVIGCSNQAAKETSEYQDAVETANVVQPSKQAVGEAATIIAEEDMANVVEPAVFVRPSDEEIQTALKNAGFYTGSIDGKIGPLTEQSIKDFQTDNGLAADGKVGRKTWSILQKHLNSEVRENDTY